MHVLQSVYRYLLQQNLITLLFHKSNIISKDQIRDSLTYNSVMSIIVVEEYS